MSRALPALLMLTLASPTACLTKRVTQDPAPPIESPESYTEPTVDGETVDGWCSDFGSTQLEELIALGMSENLQLASALWRVEQANAAFIQARSTRMPTLGADFSASYQQQYNAGFEDIDFPAPPGAEGGAGGVDPTFQFDSYSLSASAQYEIDVWGRRAAQAEAARRDALAARDDAETLALTLSAQIAETYFAWIAQRETLRLIDSQIDLNERTLEVLELRFEQGISPISPVLQQRQQVASLEASRQQAATQLELTRYQLAILVGQAPSSLGLPTDSVALPALPAAIAVGVPSDLLDQRPDVRAARRRVEAADFRVSEAIGSRLPTLSISGNIGFSSGEFTSLFENLVYAIMGSIQAPLFDGFAGRGRVDAAEAATFAALAEYGQTYLTAIKEVEDALLQERRQRVYIESLERQLRAARDNLDSVRQRFQLGEADTNFLDVLAPQQAIEQIERTLIGAQRAQLAYRVQLCRAVGGAWTRDVVSERELLLQPRSDDDE